MTRISLPFPPSVNSMFANVPGKGRVKSKEYKAWTIEALWELKAQKVKPIDGELTINIGLVAPSKRAMDCDNRIKPILDILTQAGVIKDDNNKHVRKVSAEWLASGEPCRVLIFQYEDAA